MWQKEKKDSAILSLALLLSLATTPMVGRLFVPTPVLAQSATEAESFTVPEVVEDGTTVRIDGSGSLAAINQSLKEQFESEFSGATVELAANGADAAISALINGTVDVVAIARGLTPEEQAQGLVQVPFYRENIAIIVSTDNPFQGGLTDQQFADIFRGNITNWSELGVAEGAIRLIDRPDTSDTRNTFRTYPPFQDGEFTTGANAIQVDEDDTAAIVAELGNDGISYAMAHHVSELPNVRVIPINETLPDNPNYVYSQPLVYAYQENPSPNVISFLGFILGSPEQEAVESARTAAAVAIAQAETAPPATTEITETAQAVPVQEQPPETPLIPDDIPLWWLLLPVGVIVLLLIWLLRSRLSAKGKNKAAQETQPSGEDHDPDGGSAEESLTAGTGDELGFIFDDKQNLNGNGNESPWDMEAPASLVNVPYPQVPIVSEKPEVEETISDDSGTNLWAGIEEQNDSKAVSTADDTMLQPWDDEETDSPSTLPDISEEILNTIADAAEPVSNSPEEKDIFADSSTFLGAGSNGNPGSQSPSPVVNLEGERSIVLKPRNGEWAYVTWYLDQSCQKALQNNNISQLGVRLYDVTNIDLSCQTPQLVQEYQVQSEIELYIAIPQCDRDYMAEIGYVTNGDGQSPAFGERWITITRSATVRVFATPPVETPVEAVNLDGECSLVLKERNPEWVYATWYIEQQETLQNAGICQLSLRLYDVTDVDLSYQNSELVQEYPIQSEIELYIAIPHCNRDYMAEIGYVTNGDGQSPAFGERWVTIAASSRIRVFSTPLKEPPVDSISLDGECSLVLKERNPEWVYATWYIESSCQETLQNAGICQLSLRLYDVTDVDLSYQNPELVQEYPIQSEIELYIAIPHCNRDYMAEIGYVTNGDGQSPAFGERWVTIAASSRICVFATPVENSPVDAINLDGECSVVLQPRNAEWAYTTWYIDECCQETLQNNGISQLWLRLYDVTDLDLSYQSPEFVQEYELESGIENKYIAIRQTDRDYIAEIGYVTSGDGQSPAFGERWVTIATSPRVRVFATPLQDTTVSPVINLDGEQSIVLKPRNAEWAYATWYLDQSCQETLQNNGISQLWLRLYDVTDLDLSYQTPHLVHEYELESRIEEKYIAIPQSDRDYIAEIGYITSGDGQSPAFGDRWVTIARSKRIRVFGIPLEDTTAENLPIEVEEDTTSIDLPPTNHESSVVLKSRTPKWAYASWYISVTDKQILHNKGVTQLYLRLYNVTGVDLSYQTPQLVQQYECDEITRDRYVAIAATDQDYIIELGYLNEANRWEMIARSEIVRVFNRPQNDFWFVADTELIIHGSTEPGAVVNIAGKPIKIKSDGTFHLRIPFSQDSINYVMTAIAANGEDSQSVHKKFSQENSAG